MSHHWDEGKLIICSSALTSVFTYSWWWFPAPLLVSLGASHEMFLNWGWPTLRHKERQWGDISLSMFLNLRADFYVFTTEMSRFCVNIALKLSSEALICWVVFPSMSNNSRCILLTEQMRVMARVHILLVTGSVLSVMSISDISYGKCESWLTTCFILLRRRWLFIPAWHWQITARHHRSRIKHRPWAKNRTTARLSHSSFHFNKDWLKIGWRTFFHVENEKKNRKLKKQNKKTINVKVRSLF